MNAASTPQLTIPVTLERDHVRGSLDAPVVLVEYGDFECPHCTAAQFVLSELEQAVGDAMALVFRNFPLTTVHPYAELAAEAAEAASVQGFYWQMHDALFDIQDSLSEVAIAEVAQALGMDVDKFRHDLTGHRFADRVREDFLSGVRSGVNGTPTFFINGRRYNGSPLLEPLLEAVQVTMESVQRHSSKPR